MLEKLYTINYKEKYKISYFLSSSNNIHYTVFIVFHLLKVLSYIYFRTSNVNEHV